MNKETYTLSRTSGRVKSGYKKTPVGIIPEDWEVKTLGEIVANKGLIRGPFGSALKKDFFVPIGYKVYEQQNAIYKDFERGSYFVDEAKFQELRRFAVRKNDFIMSCSGTIGELYQIPGNYLEGVINQALLLIRLNPLKILYGFFENIFQTPLIKNRILESQGGAIKNLVGMSQIRKLKLPIPPLEEQKTIANCLSTWDSGIEKLTQLIQAKKQQKKGLMQQLLTGTLRLRSSSGEKFVEEWKEVRLGEISKRVKRKNDELNDNVITISAQRGFVKQEEYFTKRVASATLSNYYLLEKGEFAYNKSYSNGYPMGAFKRLDDFDRAVVTTLYICFKIKQNVDSEFILNFFEAGLMNRSLTKIAQEGGRAHGLLNIGLSDFFNLKLAIPAIEEQTAIANILQSADKEIELLEQKLSFFQQQKKGLMQVLLTGEKRLKK